MEAKNLYRKKSRIWNKKTREIIKFFSLDLPSSKTHEIIGLNPKTIDDWYLYIRKCIFENQETEKAEVWSGTMEIDESYFWPTRVRGKRWRWAWMKTIVFGLLKRNGKVYTEIVPDVKKKTLLPIIRWKVKMEDTEINSDGWPAYDGLVDIGYEKHYRVHHGANEFARWNQHINWIESFWSFTKRRLSRFNGIKKAYFYYYLKESEFRYNCRINWKDIYKEILKLLRKTNR